MVVLESLPFDAFMRLLAVSDIMLDSSPMSGGVTSFEALHVSLPIVTAPVLSINSTCFTKAMYKRLGITDLLAQDAADFVDTAVRTGKNYRRRVMLRERIRAATASDGAAGRPAVTLTPTVTVIDDSTLMVEGSLGTEHSFTEPLKEVFIQFRGSTDFTPVSRHVIRPVTKTSGNEMKIQLLIEVR